jgi:hypothetical protein
LAQLRAGLRERMLPTICDAQRFTRELEAAYSAWREGRHQSQHAAQEAERVQYGGEAGKGGGVIRVRLLSSGSRIEMVSLAQAL